MAPTPARKLAGWRKSTLRPRSGTMAQRPTGKRANARVARVWNFRPSSPLKKDSAASLGERDLLRQCPLGKTAIQYRERSASFAN
jgi:hypothetical protein